MIGSPFLFLVRQQSHAFESVVFFEIRIVLVDVRFLLSSSHFLN